MSLWAEWVTIIFDFPLLDEDMTKIAAVDKNPPFYGRNEDALKQFAARRPDVERQK